MEKRILRKIIIFSLVLPFLASAQIAAPDTCTLKRDLSDINGNCTPTTDVGYGPGVMPIEDYGMCCLVNTIYSVTDWIFYIALVFVGIMIVIGAFYIITAGGAPDKVNTGRNYILYAVIGMVVAFFARAIPAIVKSLVAM